MSNYFEQLFNKSSENATNVTTIAVISEPLIDKKEDNKEEIEEAITEVVVEYTSKKVKNKSATPLKFEPRLENESINDWLDRIYSMNGFVKIQMNWQRIIDDLEFNEKRNTLTKKNKS